MEDNKKKDEEKVIKKLSNLTLPAGLASILRAKYIKSEYYSYIGHLIDIAATLLEYLEGESRKLLKYQIEECRELQVEIDYYKNEIKKYEEGWSFITYHEYREIKRELVELEIRFRNEIDKLRVLLNYLFKDTSILQKPISQYQLKSMPLTADEGFDSQFDEEV